MNNFFSIILALRKYSQLSLFSKLFLLWCFTFITSNASATNVPPKNAATWGCKIGQKIYWNYLGTNNVSGGITYYHFNPSGEYTQWDNDYALRPEYRCYRFLNSSPANQSCKVNGVIGQRGHIASSLVYCSIDSDLAMLLMVVGLYLAYNNTSISRNFRTALTNNVLSA